MSDRGYGAIYGQTHWGSGDAFTNQIGWGSALFYILDPAAFQQRVLLDDGELEAFECVSKALRRFPQADDGRLTYEPYAARVVADSGVLEARTCTINDINELKQ